MCKHIGRRSRLIGVALLMTLIASACEVADWGAGGAEREFFCDPTDVAINDGHGTGHVGHEFPYTEEKGPLSDIECLSLDFYLTRAVDFVSDFPTAADAEDNGWHQIAPWIPGQGTHHLDIQYGIPSTFDPTRPTMLMYDSNSRSGQLTGMVWVVSSGHMPPEGFAGDNDHWHNHQALCYRNGSIIGDGITDAECTALGGYNIDASGIWLLHVWLPEYEGWTATDIFNKEHPTI